MDKRDIASWKNGDIGIDCSDITNPMLFSFNMKFIFNIDMESLAANYYKNVGMTVPESPFETYFEQFKEDFPFIFYNKRKQSIVSFKHQWCLNKELLMR